LADGTAVREKGDERIYLIIGGAKVHFPGPAWYERFGEPPVQVVPRGVLAEVPDVPRDGTLVREWSDRCVYRIERGAPWLLSEAEADAERERGAVAVVPDGSLPTLPLRGSTPGEALRYEVLAVKFYEDQTRMRALDPGVLRSGSRPMVVITVRNTGSMTWKSYGTTPIRLGTWRPQDHISTLYTNGWLSVNRPAGLLENEVPPGGEGTFEFSIAVPPEAGAWSEDFNVVAETWAWAPSDPRCGLRIQSRSEDREVFVEGSPS
jgi:hypothetical protein